MPTTVIAGTLVSVLAALVYAHVGRLLARRPVSAEHRLAARLFALWWLGLAAGTLLGAAQNVLALAGVRDRLTFE